MISTFRDRSRSPAPRVARDEGDLRPEEASDHPLRTSWRGEKRPWRDPKKNILPSEQTEALQSTRKVSNSVFLKGQRVSLRRPDVDRLVSS
jgi:hypothetical protein